MTLVNFVAFVVFKILENLVSKTSKTVQRSLTFILNLNLNLALIMPCFQQFLLKRMPVVSLKMVLIKNKAALLCAAMGKHVRGFAATIYCITFRYSLCHYTVQFLQCTRFQINFGMGTKHFQKVVIRMKLFLSLSSFTRYIVNIGV